MKAIIEKTEKLQGAVLAPSSKSQSIRGLVLALLAKGRSILENPLDCEDTQTAIKVCRDLGAKIKVKADKIVVQSRGFPIKPNANKINTGNSGITTRFILPVLGLRQNFNKPIIFDCGEQMRGRPIESLVNALNSLGMRIRYLKKRRGCPLLVKGKLMGGKAEVNGLTSQYLSALLLSLPLAEKNSEIRVKNLRERPYADMTLKWLDDFGVKYSHRLNGRKDKYKIKGNQSYKAFKKSIPGDFSSVSSLLAAGSLIGPKIVLRRLDAGDAQGDKRLIEILKKMGGDVKALKSSISVKRAKNLRGININAQDIPDLLPTLAVIATQAKGRTKIYNVKQARIKETDRIHSMAAGLKALGARVQEKADGLTVYQSKLAGTKVNGYNDHRTVMALTVAGMLANGKTIITDAEAVNKTYPRFYEEMKKLGAKIRLSRKRLKSAKTARHIILLGFKNVGKSAIGRALAKQTNKNFADLDEQVEKAYFKRHKQKFTCRQIMLKVGQEGFRQLENSALEDVLRNKNETVISLGGGAPMHKPNRLLILGHKIIHITAPKNIVYERIMINGRPAFFSPHEHPLKSFNRTWRKRAEVYNKLSKVKINNAGILQKAVAKIKSIISQPT